MTASATLGDREFPLLFVLGSLDKLENQRVLVTGRLEGEGGAKGINVSAVTSQGAACQSAVSELRWRLRRPCQSAFPRPQKRSGSTGRPTSREPVMALSIWPRRLHAIVPVQIDVSGIWQTDLKFNFDLAADLKPEEVPMLPIARALYTERQGNLGKDDPEGYMPGPLDSHE